MAVGGEGVGGNPHATENQLVCEDAIFVSIYPILVCLVFSFRILKHTHTPIPTTILYPTSVNYYSTI